MNSGAKFAGLLFAGLLFLSSGGMLFSAQEQEVTLEDIFGLMPKHVVMTAARHPQPVKDSPASITVITGDEIRESGATSVPQLLRSVAGLNVVQASASEWAVTAHENAEFPGSGVLTLIDGRVASLDIFSIVPWQALPINLDDISRIEVVKSPSSALWGANAMNGIINIVTKSPDEAAGTRASARLGGMGDQIHAFSRAGFAGVWGYRLSAGYATHNQFFNPLIARSGAAPTARRENGAVLLERNFSDDNRLEIRTGGSRSDGEILTALGQYNREGVIAYLQATQQWGGWRWNLYFNETAADVSFPGAAPAVTDMRTLVGEVQDSVPLWEKHLVTWGMDGRYNISHAPRFVGNDKAERRWALFLQEEYQPWNFLRFSVGGRYDYFSEIRDLWSGNFGAVLAPSEGHTFRASAGRSFNKPDTIGLFADLTIPANLRDLNPALPSVPFSFNLNGNRDLAPERVDAVEVGYLNTLWDRFSLQLNAYLKRQRDDVAPVIIAYYPANALFPGSPPNTIPLSIVESNYGYNHTWGGEVGMDWFMARGATVFTNYSLQRESGSSLGQLGPENRANFGVRYRHKRLSLYGVAHYVDIRRFQLATKPSFPKGPLTVPAYHTVDARLGFELTPRIELSIAGSNIFNHVHREYVDTDYIERRVLVGVSVEF